MRSDTDDLSAMGLEDLDNAEKEQTSNSDLESSKPMTSRLANQLSFGGFTQPSSIKPIPTKPAKVSSRLGC